MDHFAGLDVSVKETSVCIVVDTGKIVREADRAFVCTARRAKPRLRRLAKNSWRPDNLFLRDVKPVS
jgi:hypothetical protein